MSVPPPPEPPEDSSAASSDDPFGIAPNASGSESLGAADDGFGDQDLDSGRPEVAASKSRIVAVMGSLGFVVLFLLYNIFSGDDPKPVEQKKKIEIVEAPPEPKLSPPPSLPNIGPSAPAPIAPPPSLTPPAIPAPVDALPVVDPQKESAAAAQLAERQRSGLFAAGGGNGGLLGGAPETPTTQQSFFGSDPNAGFANSASVTQAARSVATRLTNLRQTIGQGRIIQATLETAISTDLPAQIRAIVSRDVYAEAGNNVLIHKGSRLIGTYNTSIVPGQNRVFILWQRVIRPDGVDIMINSPGVDNLGFAGLEGFLDTKFQQVFSRAVLASIISIGLAVGADSAGLGETSQTSSVFGGNQSTTQQGDAGATATVQALQNLGNISQQFLTNFVNVRPTILVDQGTPVNVMLNRDLVFPANVAAGGVIQ